MKKSNALGFIRKIFMVFIQVTSLSLFVLAIFFLSAAIYFRIIGERHTMIFGFSFFEVITDSMEPEILVGEIVIVRRINPELLEIGDVISFFDNEKINTHKIIYIGEYNVITRGINASGEDAPVLFDAIIGRVVANSMTLGNFISFLRSWYGFVFLILVPAIGIMIYQTWRFGLKLKEIRQKNATEQLKIDVIKAEIAQLNENLHKNENKENL